MKTNHRQKPSLRTRILRRLACIYLRRKLKNPIAKAAACSLGIFVLLSLYFARPHRMK